MTWLTHDAARADDRYDPDDCPQRWCDVHGRPYYGRECASCVLDELKQEERCAEDAA